MQFVDFSIGQLFAGTKGSQKSGQGPGKGLVHELLGQHGFIFFLCNKGGDGTVFGFDKALITQLFQDGVGGGTLPFQRRGAELGKLICSNGFVFQMILAKRVSIGPSFISVIISSP